MKTQWLRPWRSFLRKWKIKQVDKIKIIGGILIQTCRVNHYYLNESDEMFFPVAEICLKSIKNRSNKQEQVETQLHIHKTIDNDWPEETTGLCFQMDICRGWIYLWLRQEWLILFWDCTTLKPSIIIIKNKGSHCRLSPSPACLFRMIIYIKKRPQIHEHMTDLDH